MVESFQFSKTPKILFGVGKLEVIGDIISFYGQSILLITGSKSFTASTHWSNFIQLLSDCNIQYSKIEVKNEPSPEFIDNVVMEFKNKNIQVVVAIGGGSVLDAGKAISAMLPVEGSVIEYMEDVGTGRIHNGEKIPFIAVPTTSGTGSEASKNAVLSTIGDKGFKKSLRHENFVPDVALIEPRLMLSCPPHITATCGMDTLTQLLESYVSTKATPMTDALAFSALALLKYNLVPAYNEGSNNLEVRSNMAYASLTSGITLANAGLGTVHGLAGVIGGYYDIPHGLICGALVGEITKKNIQMLKDNQNEKNTAILAKYGKIGELFANQNQDIMQNQDIIQSQDTNQSKGIKQNQDIMTNCGYLTQQIDSWKDTLKIPNLSLYGIKQEDLPKLANETSNRNNPYALSPKDIEEILKKIFQKIP